VTDAVRGRCERRADTCLVISRDRGWRVDEEQTRHRDTHGRRGEHWETRRTLGDEENTGRRGEHWETRRTLGDDLPRSP